MIISENLTKNYTKVCSTALRDQRLSIKERGLLATLYSLGDNWDFTQKGLACILPDGRDTIRNALKKLIEYGYITQKITRDKNGKFKTIITLVSAPITEKSAKHADKNNTTDGNTTDGNTADGNTTDGNTADGNTADGNTADGNTVADNPHQYNNKTPKNNNKESISHHDDAADQTIKSIYDQIELSALATNYVKNSDGSKVLNSVKTAIEDLYRHPDNYESVNVSHMPHPREEIVNMVSSLNRNDIETLIDKIAATAPVMSSSPKYILASIYNYVTDKRSYRNHKFSKKSAKSRFHNYESGDDIDYDALLEAK